MASKLTGVDRKLRWGDFKVVTTPPAGVPDYAVAQTLSAFTAVGGTPHNVAPSGAAKIFQIPDNLVVNVFLKPVSWRLALLSAWPGERQVWLIKHEQGHYDIHALMVRDFFIRMQMMMGQPFMDPAALHAQIVQHRAATVDRIATLQANYDNDTANSLNRSEQWHWWGAIERASQLHRQPLVAGADGRYLRLELADALKAAGLD